MSLPVPGFGCPPPDSFLRQETPFASLFHLERWYHLRLSAGIPDPTVHVPLKKRYRHHEPCTSRSQHNRHLCESDTFVRVDHNHTTTKVNSYIKGIVGFHEPGIGKSRVSCSHIELGGAIVWKIEIPRGNFGNSTAVSDLNVRDEDNLVHSYELEVICRGPSTNAKYAVFERSENG
ncbi:hypothetical protein PM082_014425 [Marasmius tenuissimus]|nr:hypothetical protein PM082_014425 [Marasmius tenuissimus]